ncbi:MAG: hypothetical protein FWD27_08920 [Coriobacteriia bacterium]|nr:hypothetical protein [Coriobacteriia bacterium]
MVALGLFFVLLAVLLVAIVLVIIGIRFLRRHRAKKVQPLLKYGINLPLKTQLAFGIVLIVLGSISIIWIAWYGVEWLIIRL